MYESAKKIYPREIGGRFDKLSKLATITLLGLFYVVPWLTLGRAPGNPVRPASAQVLPARTDALATGFPLPRIVANHRGAVVVLFHGFGGSPLVWLCLPANRVDRGVHLDGAADRGHALAAHETRQGTLVVEQVSAQSIEAISVDHVLDVDRIHVRRLLHAGS